MRLYPIPLLSALLALWSGPAAGQWHRASDPVALPISSLVGQDDVLSLDINPGLLPLQPTWGVAYVHSEVEGDLTWLGRGDAVYLGTPLLLGLSGALSLQSIRPTSDSGRAGVAQRADRGMAAFSLGFAAGKRLGIGMTTRAFTSADARVDGLVTWDLGLALRLSPRMTLGLVGRDLLATREGEGSEALGLSSSVVLSASLRPWTRLDLVVDGALVMDADQRVGGRGGVRIPVPGIGTAAALVEAERLGDRDERVRMVAEVAGRWGTATAAVGGSFDAGEGYYGMLRVEGLPRRGVPRGGYVLDLKLSGLGPRGIIATSLALDRALHDPRVKGVLLRPRGSGIGRAYAQELRLQIQSLRKAGKPVVCHLDSASGSEYYACAAADETLIDPVGNMRLIGTGATVVLFGDTLRKLGVRADMLRIGGHKSAPEQYTQGQMGEPAREQLLQLIDDAHERLLVDLDLDLEGHDRTAVAAFIDEGLQLSDTARDRGFVAGLKDEQELLREGLERFEHRPIRASLPPDLDRAWGVPARVGVVVVDESIVDGENEDIPFLEMHSTGGDTVIAALDGMLADPTVRAIVLRVDSPGGAVLASDRIWRAVRRAKEKKPVVVSMGSVAASGGYYVACGADEIWANPSTVTGSIGVFMGKADVATLAEKLGIGVEHFGRGKRFGGDSMWRPFTSDERAALSRSIRSYYRRFLERVASGRVLSIEQVDSVARGRVLSGDRALALGLVDRLGGFASALARARELGGLSADAPVVVRPKRPSGLLDYVLGQSGEMAAVRAALPALGGLGVPQQVSSLSRLARMAALMNSEAPLALLPYDIRF